MPFTIVLAAVDAPLADAWAGHCGDLGGGTPPLQVTVHRGSILDVHCDAVVSPANSFGFMDGGIDHAYSHRFGWGVQRRLQDAVRGRHHGELLVGRAEAVWTDDAAIPFVIAAPTMRVPMVLPADTVSPYLAARAVLLLILHERFADGPFAGESVADVVRTVAFPGLGTGIGRVPPDVCAKQVRAAVTDVVLGGRPFPPTWAEAQDRHQLLYGELLYGERVRDLQREQDDRLPWPAGR